MTRLLIVTAVAAEHDAIRAALPDRSDPVDPADRGDPSDPVGPARRAPAVRVIIGGAGPAESGAATAAALARSPADLVLSAGIGGGFDPAALGSIAVAASIVFADLGAETADGFTPLDGLGFGRTRYDVAPQLAVELTDRTGGHLGTILTVATVTGTAATATALRLRCPDAVAEAMEGAGVAAAAVAVGVAFGEVRAISNVVGPRDRASWRIPDALAALGRAVAAIAAAPLGSAAGQRELG